jgi:hypothetical protein
LRIEEEQRIKEEQREVRFVGNRGARQSVPSALARRPTTLPTISTSPLSSLSSLLTCLSSLRSRPPRKLAKPRFRPSQREGEVNRASHGEFRVPDSSLRHRVGNVSESFHTKRVRQVSQKRATPIVQQVVAQIAMVEKRPRSQLGNRRLPNCRWRTMFHSCMQHVNDMAASTAMWSTTSCATRWTNYRLD